MRVDAGSAHRVQSEALWDMLSEAAATRSSTRCRWVVQTDAMLLNGRPPDEDDDVFDFGDIIGAAAAAATRMRCARETWTGKTTATSAHALTTQHVRSFVFTV